MTTDPTAPAFPRSLSETSHAPRRYALEQDGVSKLEYFAAAAFTGILSADTSGDLTAEQSARAAVKHARALIAALNAEAGA